MNTLFDQFKVQLKNIIPQLIAEILSHQPDEKVYGIAFVTTDDFYGMYVAFETEEHLKAVEKKLGIDGLRWFPNEWGYSDQNLPSKYGKELYHNLVAVIQANDEIDFTKASDEKWAFALSLLAAIREAVLELPPSLFEKYGYHKKEIAFLATMSDGDYMDEMLVESARNFNAEPLGQSILKDLTALG